MKELHAYRIVEIDGERIRPLFHGINGKREFTFDTWIRADKKHVSDGSQRSRKTYLSGFHVLLSKEDAEKFFNRRFKIKENRRVVPCRVRGDIRPKYSGTCYLADEIYFDKDEVEKILEVK